MAGKITASSGAIGGFTIKESYLTSGNAGTLSSPNGVYLGTNGISCGTSTSKFKVTSDGEITAESGTIGGFTISTTGFSYFNGSRMFKLSTTGDELLEIGNSSHSSYMTMAVSDSGKITAPQITISTSSTRSVVVDTDVIEISSSTSKISLGFLGSSYPDGLKIPYGSYAYTYYAGAGIYAPPNWAIYQGNTGSNKRLSIDAVGIRIADSTDMLGFYGDLGAKIQTVNKLASTATLANTITKVNDLLTALAKYNLIKST